MAVGAGSLKQVSDNSQGGSDVAPTLDVPLSALATIITTIVDNVPVSDGTTIEDGGT